MQLIGFADSESRRQLIRTTDEHPYHSVLRGWTPSQELEIGEAVSGPAQVASAVTSNVRQPRPGGVTVYNMEIEGTHTYFVRAEGSEAEPVWVHNASALYAKGLTGRNYDVDAVAYELQSAATRAEALLAGGGTGGTRWGRIYQRYRGTGSWREQVAFGNAIQQVADNVFLPGNTVIDAAGVVFNSGRPLGLRNASGNLLRPDYQMYLGSGQYAVFDITTYAQARAGKIMKYDSAIVPYLIDIGY